MNPDAGGISDDNDRNQRDGDRQPSRSPLSMGGSHPPKAAASAFAVPAMPARSCLKQTLTAQDRRDPTHPGFGAIKKAFCDAAVSSGWPPAQSKNRDQGIIVGPFCSSIGSTERSSARQRPTWRKCQPSQSERRSQKGQKQPIKITPTVMPSLLLLFARGCVNVRSRTSARYADADDHRRR